MTTLSFTQQLTVLSCCNCGVEFALPEDLRQELVKERRRFYCPNGHGQSYVGKTEAEKLREQLEAEQRRIVRLRAEQDRLVAQRDHAEAQARGYKGAMVQARKRSAKGVCPAPGCKRSFVDVAKHVATKHPELVDEHPHG